jgi:60S ribosomal subunit assembly/export protein LOC1
MTKKTKKVNGTRSIEPDVFRDDKAKNQLAINNKNYDNSKLKPKAGKNRVSKSTTGKSTKAKKQPVYSEKDLDLPKLNTAINPEGVKLAKRGKKGKKFADEDAMMRIMKSVSQTVDSKNASKLEKARQLEEIREAKRKEMERKDQEKEERLSQKKSELRKKRKKSTPRRDDDDSDNDKKLTKPKKKVSFA